MCEIQLEQSPPEHFAANGMGYFVKRIFCTHLTLIEYLSKINKRE